MYNILKLLTEAADDITDPAPYLFDSDVTALRTFVRELVTQSIIPTMERNTATWNEQILSRRRGISGRFHRSQNMAITVRVYDSTMP